MKFYWAITTFSTPRNIVKTPDGTKICASQKENCLFLLEVIGRADGAGVWLVSKIETVFGFPKS